MNAVRPGYKQTELGVIPTDWDYGPAASLDPFITSGSRGWAKYYAETGSPFIRITNLTRDSIYPDLSDLKWVNVQPTDPEAIRTALNDGDIIISITADIGIIGYVNGTIPKPAYINQHIACLRIGSKKADPRFLSHYLASTPAQTRFRQITDVSAKTGINLATVAQLQLVLPPLPEQHAIAEALGDAAALIAALEAMIAKKHDVKQGAMQELLTGRRRLPGFQGEWKQLRIDEFTSCTSGGTPATKVSAYWGGEIPWMSSGELHVRNVWNVAERITQLGLDNSSAKLIPTGCVLIGLAGQGKTRGTVAINRIPLTTNQSIGAILPSSVFSEDYLYHNLVSRYEELREISSGDGGRGGLNLNILGALEVPFPVLDEQQAIAAVLSDMDAEIAALENKLAKARAVKQGMMQVLLTGEVRLV